MNNKIEFKANNLLDVTDCRNLPIDVYQLAQRLGYNIKNYSVCKTLIRTLSAEDITKKYPSVSFTYNGIYYILLSDNLTRDEERKLIAHEIGHIQLHELHGLDVSRFHKPQLYNEIQENEANTFALYLLAPLPLLSEHKIKDPSTIKELTGLSLNDCGVIFNRLQDYYTDKCVSNSRNRLLKRTMSPFLILKQSIIIATLCITFMLCTIWYLATKTVTLKNNDTYTTQSKSAYSGSVPKESTTNETSIYLGNAEITTYYWTDSGTVFHTHKDCRSLKNSKEIHSGSLSEAQNQKDRLCKFCEDKLQ